MGETLRGVLFGALLGGGAALGLASVGGKRNPVGLLEKTVYVYQDSTFGSALNECATLFTKVDTKATQQLIRDCDSLVGLFSRVSDPDGAHSDAFSEALILRRSVVSLVVGLEKKARLLHSRAVDDIVEDIAQVKQSACDYATNIDLENSLGLAQPREDFQQ